MTRPHAPTKDLRDKNGILLPSSHAEIVAAGLDKTPMLPRSVAKKQKVAIEDELSACHYSHGNWHPVYKIIQP